MCCVKKPTKCFFAEHVRHRLQKVLLDPLSPGRRSIGDCAAAVLREDELDRGLGPVLNWERIDPKSRLASLFFCQIWQNISLVFLTKKQYTAFIQKFDWVVPAYI